MSKELLDRLRDYINNVDDIELRKEAADTIERLEADTQEVNAARIYLREKGALLKDLHEVTKQRDELMALLIRYRNETPIGHQPHMIVHLADEAIASVKEQVK